MVGVFILEQILQVGRVIDLEAINPTALYDLG